MYACQQESSKRVIMEADLISDVDREYCVGSNHADTPNYSRRSKFRTLLMLLPDSPQQGYAPCPITEDRDVVIICEMRTIGSGDGDW